MIAREQAIVALTPAADQTGYEGYFVEASSGNASIVNAATDIPIGVITEGAATTGKSAVALHGFGGTVKVKVTATSPGTIALGTYLQLKNDGTVQADAGSGERVIVGRACESGAAGELIEAVLIRPRLIGNAVTLGNTNSEIGGLTIGATYSQSEVTALRDKCEELADDVRALYLALQTNGTIA